MNRSISLWVSTDGAVPARGSDPVGALGWSLLPLESLGVMGPTVDNLLSNPRQLADRVILQCQSDCGGLLFWFENVSHWRCSSFLGVHYLRSLDEEVGISSCIPSYESILLELLIRSEGNAICCELIRQHGEEGDHRKVCCTSGCGVLLVQGVADHTAPIGTVDREGLVAQYIGHECMENPSRVRSGPTWRWCLGKGVSRE